MDIQCSTFGKGYDKFIIPAGGIRKLASDETKTPVEDHSGYFRTEEDIFMDGVGVITFINSKVPKQIKQLLKRNHLDITAIDKFVFHQVSKTTLDSLKRLLNVPDEKFFSNIHKIIKRFTVMIY